MIIMDAGHGSINPSTGKYVTPGKRSPIWDDGTQYFEGVGNREIVAKLHKLCQFHGIDSTILVPEWEDISLLERVKRVNKIYSQHKDAILISIHSNGFSKETANGFEIFTSNGKTKSDDIAKVLHKEYLEVMDDIHDRGIKEAGFYMVKRTHCPAVLYETMFHTNEKECKILMNDQDRVVEAIFNGILELRSEGLIPDNRGC
jgi:N-acetylmuramoyl-L-alanine amidase